MEGALRRAILTRNSSLFAGALAITAACSSAPQQGFESGAVEGDGGSNGGNGSSSGGSGGAGSSGGPASSGGSSSGSGADVYVAPLHYSDAAAGKTYDTYVPDADIAAS